MPQDHEATRLIEDVRNEIGRADNPTLGTLIDALDHRGYGPALAVLPLVELSPIGGIPGIPTLLALTVAMMALRLMAGKEHFWLPDRLRRIELSKDRVDKAVGFMMPVTKRIDGTLHERVRPLASERAVRIAAVVILLLCIPVPALELVPFATSVPMIAISVFGFAMLFRDGLLMGIGFAAAGIAGAWGIYALFLS